LAATGAAAFLVSVPAFGALEGLITFQAGTPALAAEVNANFGAIKAFVDQLETNIANLEAENADLTARLDALEAQEVWQSAVLENGWEDYGSSFTAARYYRDALGVVHLQGLVRYGTVGTNIAVFTLPEGYRPYRTHNFSVVAGAGDGRIQITTDGIVSLVRGSSTYVALDGITFRQER
jgi:hypothetical protein